MKKALAPDFAQELEQIPNIGKQIAADLRLVGIQKPSDLKGTDPYKLYVRVCERTKFYKDPCMLDVFISAAYFMDGKGSKPWWDFTDERKRNFHLVDSQAKRFRK